VGTKALKSLQLSYHLHKSALTFTGDQQLHNDSPNIKSQSKWTQYYMSVHSLELHLKAALTRMQFINTFITTESKSKELTSSMSSEILDNDNASMKELESAYNLLKNELESAICCWEEGFHNLKLISGIDKSKSISMKEETSQKEEDRDQHSNSVNQLSLKEPEEITGDCVFEGYTDFDDDTDFHQTILTREELEKESRSREESQHLLQELRNVLLTKTKDPLITDAGFVKPNKRQCNRDPNRKESTCTSEFEDNQIAFLGDKSHSCTASNMNDATKSDHYIAKDMNDIKSDNQSNMKEKSGECSRDCKEPLSAKNEQTLPSRQWPSKAFSLAIQEAARSRGNALMEESYGSSDSD
jgi:hypothetical protein